MTERNARKRKLKNPFDYTLLFIVLFLVGFGLIMIYSTSSYEAAQSYGSSTYFLRKQIFAVILGLAVMIVAANIDYHFWANFATLAYLLAVGLLLAIIPFGKEVNGAKRWLYIGPISLQPAEVAKLCMIVFLAVMVQKIGKKIRTMKGFCTVMLMPLPIVLMVWRITNNLSSAIIILGIAVLMIFVASPDYKKFLIMGSIAIVAVVGFVLAIKFGLLEAFDFRMERILAWLDPEAYADGKGFQTLQALYAIGSGGIWGKGLGQSMQKLGFIPEAQNDMIFSIICEELGLFGAVAIILMFLLLIWRLMDIAMKAPDLFGALLAVGVMGHIAIQVILNIAVVTNTIPNTGISLPFISYGGSSVTFLLAEFGLVFNVATHVKQKEVN